MNSIHNLFLNPELDLDAGGIKLIDRDEEHVYIGLFEFDDETGDLKNKPVAVWTVEVSCDKTGARP